MATFREEPKIEAILKQSQINFLNSNLEQGIQRIIEAVMLNKNYQEELPRKVSIGVFQVLGGDHPLTKQYRKRFDMALY
jgi:putative thioredoxin